MSPLPIELNDEHTRVARVDGRCDSLPVHHLLDRRFDFGNVGLRVVA